MSRKMPEDFQERISEGMKLHWESRRKKQASKDSYLAELRKAQKLKRPKSTAFRAALPEIREIWDDWMEAAVTLHQIVREVEKEAKK